MYYAPEVTLKKKAHLDSENKMKYFPETVPLGCYYTVDQNLMDSRAVTKMKKMRLPI